MSDGRFDQIYGNAQVKRFFEQELQEGRLSHAYLLEGGKGSGRHTLALAIATALAGGDERPEAGKIARGISPDCITVGLREDKKTLGIDRIRAMKEAAYLRPSELDCKIFILESCEALTVQAQNAMLKLLEEPPAGVYFFLLCENAARLLPTVRSRVPTVRMERFSGERLRELLSLDPAVAPILRQDPERVEEALRGCDGALGRAKELLLGKKADPKLRAQLLEAMEALEAKDPARLLPAIRRLGGGKKDRAALDTAFLQWENALRDLLLCRSDPTGQSDAELLFFSDREEARACGKTLPVGALLRLLSRLELARQDLGLNANIALLRTALTPDLLLAVSNKND